MATRTPVHTTNAPPPLPVYSQAIICNGMVYCSGQVAMDPQTKQLVQGGVADRTVSSTPFPPRPLHPDPRPPLPPPRANTPLETMPPQPLRRARRRRLQPLQRRPRGCLPDRYEQLRRYEYRL